MAGRTGRNSKKPKRLYPKTEKALKRLNKSLDKIDARRKAGAKNPNTSSTKSVSSKTSKTQQQAKKISAQRKSKKPLSKGMQKVAKTVSKLPPTKPSKGTYRTGSQTVKPYAAEQAKKARRKPPAKPKKSPKPKTPTLRANAAHRVPPSAAKAAKVGSRLLGRGPLTAAGLALLGISALHGAGAKLGGKPDPKTNKRRASGSGAAKPRQGLSSRKRPASTTTRKRPAKKRPATTPPNKPSKSRNPTELKRKSYEKTKGGDYPVYKKNSASAKSFRETFRLNRQAGKKTFKWRGRTYTTKLKKKKK